jgi:ribonuclease Z
VSRVIILGSSAAVPEPGRENTHIVLDGAHGAILIDCSASPILRLHQAGVDPKRLRAIIVTHFHPDHTHGLPILLLDLWLMGRTAELPLYGPAHCMERVRRLMDMYGWEDWKGFYPVTFHNVEAREGAPVLENEDFVITATPSSHTIPCIGVRAEDKATGRVFAYSSDTAPSAAIVRLAAGADLFIHEATGNGPGHSTPAQAGAAAREAEVGRLLLIHYPPGAKEERWLAEAKATFGGPVELARDLAEYSV